jgi:DNA-binding Lrp family transcriptional regulator
VVGSLDFAILAESSGEGPAGLGFDPRRSPELIAHRLGLSAATVRRRLTQWRSRGFLLGYDVLPNPGLLGGWMAARIIDFPDPVSQKKAIESLSLIDGVFQIVPARTQLAAAYFVDSESQAERRLRQLRAIEGATQVSPEMRYEFPPCSHRMTRPDWKLVLALRRHPEASVAELAASIGQSTRTTSRRFDVLLDEGALIFDPILEFSRFHQSLAALVATVAPRERREKIERQIRALYPQSAPGWGPTPPDLKGETATVFLWVTAPTAAELDELNAKVAHIPGVSEAHLWYGQSTVPVRPWLNERIETILRLSGPKG